MPSAETSRSIDLKASVQASDQDTRRDTPGGPITGNRVVPCSWQKTRQGGPMLVAGDTPGLGSPAWREFGVQATGRPALDPTPERPPPPRPPLPSRPPSSPPPP